MGGVDGWMDGWMDTILLAAKPKHFYTMLLYSALAHASCVRVMLWLWGREMTCLPDCCLSNQVAVPVLLSNVESKY